MNNRAPLLSAQHLEKRYGPVEALVDVSIELYPREIHGLIGENGAGKSTLIRVLAGIEEHDGGRILPSTEPVLRQAVVPQYPRMAESLPIWQNVLVGAEASWGPFVVGRHGLKVLRTTAKRFGIDLNVRKRTGDLNGTETRLAALLAGLVREPNLLILDEPTVGLAVTDKEAIFHTLRVLRSAGIGVLLISHDLAEIATIADTVTVLRNGRSVATISEEISLGALADAMLGSSPVQPNAVAQSAEQNDRSDRAGIVFDDVQIYHPQSDRRIGPLNLVAPPGAITAITGVRESGIDLIEGYLSGECRVVAGSASIDSSRLSSSIDPGTLRKEGLVYIPSDRFDIAAALDGSVEENAIVQNREQVHPRGIRSTRSIGGTASSILARFGVTAQRSVPLGALSGGTIQKLILARELERPTGGCVISEPFSGLDIVSQGTLVDILTSLAASGTAVVVLTSTVDAAVSIADTVVVLREGVLYGPYPPSESDRIHRAFAGLVEETR